MDFDGDEFINRKDMFSYFSMMLKPVIDAKIISVEEVNAAINYVFMEMMDGSVDGHISFEQFKKVSEILQ